MRVSFCSPCTADFSEQIVTKTSGVACVLDAMKKHDVETAVQVAGCIAIHNFTTSSGTGTVAPTRLS